MEKLKVTDSCIGCGLCVSQSEKYFEFNDEGMSRPKQDLPEDVSDFGVVVGDAGGRFDHEKDQVGLFDGYDHLLADGFFEYIIRIGGPSSGIHYGELFATPLAFTVMAVPCHACSLVDDGFAHPDEPVEQCGFADIRPSDYSY